MYRKSKLLTFFIPSLILAPLAIMSVEAQAKLTERSKVFINGLAQIRVGMTVAQASKAAGTRLVGDGSQYDRSCFYVKPSGGPKDVDFMVTNDRISTVDVFRNSRITTAEGAKIGDTEARIKSLYPGQIKVTKHKYTNGHYLTFIPKNSADKNYRIVFETDGDRVTRFRSGKLPEVEYVEGCS